jgi:hypothetical protein
VTFAIPQPLAGALSAVAFGLVASLVFPFVVHLVPMEGGPPLGARLLPIFYATLVLALRGGPLPAVLVATFAPFVNRLVTGMPAGPMLPTLLFELVLFTVLVLVAVRFVPRAAPYLAPLAYLIAALSAKAVLIGDFAIVDTAIRSLQVSWPGVLMLFAIGATTAWAGGASSARARR